MSRPPSIDSGAAATMLALLDHARASCPEAPACYLRGYLIARAGEPLTTPKRDPRREPEDYADPPLGLGMPIGRMRKP